MSIRTFDDAIFKNVVDGHSLVMLIQVDKEHDVAGYFTNLQNNILRHIQLFLSRRSIMDNEIDTDLVLPSSRHPSHVVRNIYFNVGPPKEGIF